MQKSSLKESGWITDLVIDHNIIVSKNNPLAGSSYLILTKELEHSRKGFINIQNIDDSQCFKWCLGRYVNPANNHPARSTNVDKDFAKKLYFNK